MRYDYIIIGAGSAGAILATRLTENPNTSVLLIEAGSDYPDLDSLPEEVKYGYKTTKDIWFSEHNWQYRARATDENDIDIPRGKVTGGSSAINGQTFLRGLPQDYDSWAESGNDQWSFQKLLPFLNKIETDTTYQDNPGDFHGTNGPIICQRFLRDDWPPASKAFVDACLDAGYPACEDANAPDTTGVGPTPMNNPDGIRWSTSIGYLGLSRHRLNLTIRPNVTVKKILFSTVEEKPRAIGIEAVSDGQTFAVEGNEIILAAGAIGSPQILMLSGVGPKQHLAEHGIDLVLDSPGVGQNLKDHPIVPLLWATKPEVELDPLGPHGQVILRFTTAGSTVKNDMIVYMHAAATLWSQWKTQDDDGAVDGPIGLGTDIGLNFALSSGEIRLNSNSYLDQPMLDYNLLDRAEDIARIRKGVRMLVELANHPRMKDLLDQRVYPLDTDLATDETLDLWIRKSVGTGHHVSCTAKMGPPSDIMAVVDQYGKVHRVGGLRVADASIMPDCVRANIAVTVMAMAEQIAHFISEGN